VKELVYTDMVTQYVISAGWVRGLRRKLIVVWEWDGNIPVFQASVE